QELGYYYSVYLNNIKEYIDTYDYDTEKEELDDILNIKKINYYNEKYCARIEKYMEEYRKGDMEYRDIKKKIDTYLDSSYAEKFKDLYNIPDEELENVFDDMIKNEERLKRKAMWARINQKR